MLYPSVLTDFLLLLLLDFSFLAALGDSETLAGSTGSVLSEILSRPATGEGASGWGG